MIPRLFATGCQRRIRTGEPRHTVQVVFLCPYGTLRAAPIFLLIRLSGSLNRRCFVKKQRKKIDSTCAVVNAVYCGASDSSVQDVLCLCCGIRVHLQTHISTFELTQEAWQNLQ